MHTSKFTMLAVAIAAASVSLSTSAQEATAEATRIDLPSSFNPVGSGARALGRGGSFIAVADDATAASWNPAALLALRKPEVAAVYSYTDLSEDVSFSEFPEANGSQDVSSSDLNYFAVSVPCADNKCGKNMVFSVNYQRLYDMSRDWSVSYSQEGDVTSTNQASDILQDGSLYAWGLAYAVQLTKTLNVGVTLNLWEDGIEDNAWEIKQEANTQVFLGDSPLSTLSTTFVDKYSFSGTNFNLGVSWKAYEDGEKQIQIGGVYKSEFDADITRDSTINGTASQNLPTSATMTMPSSYGIGVAYRLGDYFTAAVDIYRTNWSNFSYQETYADGTKSAPVFPVNGLTNQDVSDTTQIRLGAEYRIISQKAGANYIIPVRAGIFQDPTPSVGDTDDIYGISLGTGVAFEHWVFDIAWQYRFGSDLGSAYLQSLGYSQDTDEHQLFGSVFYRF